MPWPSMKAIMSSFRPVRSSGVAVIAALGDDALYAFPRRGNRTRGWTRGWTANWQSALGVWQFAVCLPCQRRLGGAAREGRMAKKLKAVSRVLDCLFRNEPPNQTMLFSKEYVGYLARELTKKLIAGGLIETENLASVTERVHAALLEEMSLEDHINDEVRVILEAYSDEMRRSGANYQEMFRKVKSELVKKYKAVL